MRDSLFIFAGVDVDHVGVAHNQGVAVAEAEFGVFQCDVLEGPAKATIDSRQEGVDQRPARGGSISATVFRAHGQTRWRKNGFQYIRKT